MILLAVGFVATLLFFATAHVLELSVTGGWPGGERSLPLVQQGQVEERLGEDSLHAFFGSLLM
ncbi:MAG: hypothetical protein BWX48_00804 [Verrucomicrobia bacterium ADurb.Bin006]|jgi:hypothetical protein|nr:MAG: hypothetical protein BWX48_00804 [Verrucomicrobia bacterium ADurb.Bin006]